jgi:hypothetical protein
MNKISFALFGKAARFGADHGPTQGGPQMHRYAKIALTLGAIAVAGAGVAYARHEAEGPQSRMARLCARPPLTGERIAERLTHRLHLTDAQKPALQDLQQAFAKSMADVHALCDSKPDFATLPGRIAFAQKRMAAMASGLEAVQPKLEAFYAGLDQTQKETINRMGPMGMGGRGHGHHAREHRSDED